jgi:hypothetical protein
MTLVHDKILLALAEPVCRFTPPCGFQFPI